MPREKKPETQPHRRYDHLRDYFNLPRFHMDFGRNFNCTDYWDDYVPTNEPAVEGDDA